jgi:hypothetical protein
MPTLTTMPFPAAAALTGNGAFGLVRASGWAAGTVMTIQRAVAARLCLAVRPRTAG